MPSYQDIEVRLRVVEDKLDFIMRSMGQQTVEQTGMLDPTTNQPVVRVIKKTFLDVYREYKDAQLQAAAAQANWSRRSAGEVGGADQQEGAGVVAGADSVPTAPADSKILLTD